MAIGAAAYASKYLINAGVKWANAPAKMRAFYKVRKVLKLLGSHRTTPRPALGCVHACTSDHKTSLCYREGFRQA